MKNLSNVYRIIALVFCLAMMSLPTRGATVTTLTLVNASTNNDIQTLTDGATIDLATTGSSLNVRADISGTATKVNFALSGAMSHTQSEGVAPYALYGDSAGNYDSWTPNVGSYTLVTDCDGANAVTVNFTVTDSGSGGGGGTGGVYLESGGLVVMEMENTASPLGQWIKKTDVASYTGSGHLEFTGNGVNGGDPNSPLTYTFRISQAGNYYLNLRARKRLDGQPSDKCNDAYVKMTGDFTTGSANYPTSTLTQDTKLYGGNADNWGWATNLDGNGADHVAAIYNFKADETYVLTISGRSIRFNIDRIVLRHSSVSKSVARDPSQPESAVSAGDDGDGTVTIGGTLRRWHRVDLKQAAKYSSETDTPNPFRDYRFNVTFTAPSGKTYVVPGYFATDGNGGDEGNVWMAHLNPSETGEWSYTVSFREGTDVAVSLAATPGSAVAPFDGKTGTFTVQASDKTGADFRAADKGMLVNRGHHYLTYGGSGKPFLFTGPGIPENILGYRGFTNTTVGIGHTFDAHLTHWHTGDPDWDSGAGKKLIGALNYIAEQGGNCIYMMSNTIGGDGKDCFPHPTTDTSKDRYDLLKLKQWDIALAHAQAKGIFLHWVLSETETSNRNYYGTDGAMTVERKLYFRMMAAVFGHYNGLKWNLGEECRYPTANRTAQMANFKAIDPYDHPVTFQVGGAGFSYTAYNDHLGDPNFDAGSFQGSPSRADMFNTIQTWRTASAGAGEPWACAWDEPQKIENDNTDEVNGYPMGRRDKMWPCLMGGGDGFLWYIQKDGGGHGFDQRIEDFTIMQNAFNWCAHIRTFLGDLPLLQMTSSMSIVNSTTGNDYTLVKDGEIYAIFNDRAGTGMTLDLSGVTGTFTVKWFDPRSGGALQDGTVTSITGGGARSLGNAPSDTGLDWAVLVTKDGAGTNTPPTVSFVTPADGDRVLEGARLPTEVTATDSDGTVANVTLYLNDVLVRQENSAPYTWGQAGQSDTELENMAPGTYTLKAVATDDDGATGEASITVTVVDLRDPDNPSGTVAGVDYERYLGTWTALPDFAALTADVTGTTTLFKLGLGEPADGFAHRYTAYIDAPADAEYTFYTTSDDGSKLYIGSTEVVANDGTHGAVEESGRIGLKAGKHAITVTYFEATGGNQLTVSWSASGLAKEEIPADKLFRVDSSNTPPVAVAGANPLTTTTGTTVDLSGSGSYDPDTAPNPTLSYSWSCTGWPAGSAQPSATNPSSMLASFVPTAEGSYTWELTVNDGADVDTDTVTITVSSGGGAPLSMTLSVPAEATEGDGTVQGSVQLNRTLTAGESVTIAFLSDDVTEATVQAGVTLVAGESTANFDITVQDDTIDDTAKTVTITASAAGMTDATDQIVILDNDGDKDDDSEVTTGSGGGGGGGGGGGCTLSSGTNMDLLPLMLLGLVLMGLRCSFRKERTV